MRLYVDLDRLELIQSPQIPRALDGFQTTLGAILPLELQFIQAGIVQELDDAVEIALACRQQGVLNPPTLAAQTTWLKTGTGEDTVYSANVAFNLQALADLFNVLPQPNFIYLNTTLQWAVGEESETSTFKVAVEYDDAAAIVTETDPVFLASEAAKFEDGDKDKLDTIEEGATNYTPPAADAGWIISNGSELKTLDVENCSLDELSRVTGTLIEKLKTFGVLA